MGVIHDNPAIGAVYPHVVDLAKAAKKQHDVEIIAFVTAISPDRRQLGTSFSNLTTVDAAIAALLMIPETLLSVMEKEYATTNNPALKLVMDKFTKIIKMQRRILETGDDYTTDRDLIGRSLS